MKPRFLTTLGVSFCGSTLLDYLLESAAKEVVSVGEARTLHMPPTDHSRRCVTCETRGDPAQRFCWLDHAARHIEHASIAPYNLYDALRQYLMRGDVLHTSDKNSAWVDTLDLPALDIGWIVLWKPLHKAYASHKTYHPNNGESQSAARYYWVWAQEYMSHLQLAGPKIVINYDDLTTHPAQVLRAICDRFGLTYDSTWPDTWHDLSRHHRLYGNAGTTQRIGAQGEESLIYCDASYRDKLTEAELADCDTIEHGDPLDAINALYEESLFIGDNHGN